MADKKNTSKEEVKEKPQPKSAAYSIKIDGRKIYLREPDRNVLKIASDKMVQATGGINMASAGEIVFNSCVIEDEDVQEIRKKDNLLVSAYVASFKLLELQEAEIEKL